MLQSAAKGRFERDLLMGPNEKKLQEIYQLYADGDLESVVAMLTDDVVIRSLGASNRLDHSGEWHGHAGARAYFQAIADNWTFPQRDLLEMFHEGDRRFVVRMAVTGVHRRTGAKASVERVDLVTMRDEKCASYFEVYDTAPLERASRH
jgi:ketosteroid isomerase-like protein